jgi:hypothetical protein
MSLETGKKGVTQKIEPNHQQTVENVVSMTTDHTYRGRSLAVVMGYNRFRVVP